MMHFTCSELASRVHDLESKLSKLYESHANLLNEHDELKAALASTQAALEADKARRTKLAKELRTAIDCGSKDLEEIQARINRLRPTHG